MHAGFAMTGTEVRTADVSVNDQDAVEVTSGMDQPLALLWFAALQNLHRSATTGCRSQELPGPEDYPVRL